MWKENVDLTAEIFYLTLFATTYHSYTFPPWLGQREVKVKDLVLAKGNSPGRKLSMLAKTK